MFTKVLRPLLPYLTVGAGLYIFHNAWVAILAYHAGIAVIAFISQPAVPFRQLLQCGNVKLVLLSLTVGASGGGLLYLLWPLLSVPPDINTYLRSIGLAGAAWPCFMTYYVMVNPILEEYYWRGLLGSSAKRPVLNDILFAGYHLLVLSGKIGVSWLAVVFLVIGGAAWYWRQISRVTEGLLAATLSHLAADVTVILSIFFLTATI
jgi:hypothetical protein